MKKKTLKTLEFDTILNMLSEFALSEKVKDQIMLLEPYMREDEVRKRLKETTQAKAIIEMLGSPPVASMTNLDKILLLVDQGAMLIPENLNAILFFITTCKRMKRYLEKSHLAAHEIAVYGNSIYELTELYDEIAQCLNGSVVDDRASKELFNIRHKITQGSDNIKLKINAVLSGNKNYFSETFVSYRNNHYTVPVKKQYKNQVKGRVIDISKSGTTYFIEPSAVARAQEKIDFLRIQEDNEVRKILYVLTALVQDSIKEININVQAMEILDYMFAKAKLSLKMNAIQAKVSTIPKIILHGGRHPLLDSDNLVPLDFELDGDKSRGVIITGPNTGGKTVVLKTLGLFSLMTQSGLHIPADEATFSMHNIVLCDIGDGQSITENLSTFSSHLTNIIKIISMADEQSFVLLDELGSGTDPTEGMGLAVAILEELGKKKPILVATTHYPEIKEFARETDGFINARMAFDKENLCPLYKLEIGEAGQSCALYIAQKLGLPNHMIKRAYDKAYSQSKVINDIDFDINVINQGDEIDNKNIVIPSIKKSQDNHSEIAIRNKFGIGDSVRVYPSEEIGIVYQIANKKGEVGVQVKKVKSLYNHKRVKLLIPASELYPDDYDMDVVFESVDNRKASKILSKRHDPNVVVEIKK